MKKIYMLLTGMLFILTSCGISSKYASSAEGQRFADGIYSSTPLQKDKAAEQASKAELQELAEQTKSSQIYLFGDQKDTVVIPENMAATIRYDKLSGTSVTVAEFDPYDFTSGWYADRYRWNSSWYYGGIHSPWYYGGYHNPWYYGGAYHAGWYDPWYYGGPYYGGWYDPWYYGSAYYGWYDPWYYGGPYYGGWYDPWYYGHLHPRYCGWYGAWEPHFHHHHVGHPAGGSHQSREVYRGSRLATTGSSRILAGSSSPSSKGSAVRSVSTTNRNSFGTSRSTSSRTVSGRSTASTSRPATASATSGRSSATYRRPAGTAPRTSGRTSTYDSQSSSGNNSYYSRSSSSSSSSSQSRSYSSPSRSSYSSGSSGGGYSRSSSGGGGGYSRSSSGGRR